MANENGPVLQTIPIPEANSPLEGELFDITKCFPEIFLLPKKQWVESLSNAQEDLHNMFSQILNFEGTIQSYIDTNPENILKLRKIEDLLLRFRMYLNNLGKDMRFYESLDQEEKQSLERLVNRHENYVIHYFTSSFEKYQIPMPSLYPISGSVNRRLSRMEETKQPVDYEIRVKEISLEALTPDCMLQFVVLFGFANERQSFSVTEQNICVLNNAVEIEFLRSSLPFIKSKATGYLEFPLESDS
ncbi:hypothetical protein ACTXT7_014300 [Hymenolepis weldensis]